MLVILSGVSGAGKDTIKKELLKRMSNVVTLPSFTSRDMRPGEVEGDHYHFISKEEFEEKIRKVACDQYGASIITYSATAKKKIKMAESLGYEKFPICIAKTQYSFSTDAKQYGVVEGFEFHVRDIVLNAGAEMLVVIAGEIMRMPGLPKEPQALHIDIVNGEIEGLS